MDKCYICKTKDATKKNSHIIPSFLASVVSSYDHRYKRDKDLLFKITPFEEKIYIGGLPDTKLESVFDYSKLTEERINDHLSTNPVALDKVFCPLCEKKLSVHLETPYSESLFNGEKKEPFVQLMFWVSVIWRASVTNDYGFKLPNPIEDLYQSLLTDFLELKEEKKEADSISKKLNFNYRIIHCPDYCKTNGGSIYAEYDTELKILSFIIGDISICITFDKAEIPANYTFFSLEKYFKEAVNNNGISEEARHIISTENFKAVMDEYVKFIGKIKIRGSFSVFDQMWTASGRPNSMPIRMKIKFLEMLCDENEKIGERHSNQRKVDIFNYLIDNVLLWY